MHSKGFEEGKRRIAEVLIEKSVNGKEFITCRHLLHETLPQFVKDSIVSLARKRLKAEKPISWNFDASIDFDDVDVKEAGERLMLALLKSVRLDREEVKLCIHNSIKIRFDLLIRPIQTLEAVFFKTTDRFEKNVFIRSVEKIGADIPLIEKLVKEVELSDFTEIDRLNYKIISQKVLKEVYSNCHLEYLLKEFKLLQKLFSFESSSENNYIDVKYVYAFLISRGLEQAASVVKTKSEYGKNQWLLEDIKAIFVLLLDEAEIEIEETIKVKKQIIFPKIIFEDDAGIVVQRQRIERQPPGPYPSIFESIEKKDKKTFVRKIFRKNEIAFKDFLVRVDKVSKWRDAKQLIDWEMEKRQVDPYSKEAVRLGDLVFAKFFSNGNYY